MKLLKYGIVLACVALLAACPPIYSGEGKGELTITASIQNAEHKLTRSARTILPEIVPASYRALFSGPEAVAPLPLGTDGTGTIQLPYGTWTLTVEGLNTAGDAVASGTETFTLSAANPSYSATVSLQALETGTGSVDLTITWPAGLNPDVGSYTTSLTHDGTAVPAGTVSTNYTASPRSLHYTQDLASGSYNLIIELGQTSSTYYKYSEALQISGNAKSQKTVSLTLAQFDDEPIPGGDGDIRVGTVTADSITINWTAATDNQYAASTLLYQVYQDDLVVGSQTANMTSYIATGLNASKSYKFFVRVTDGAGYSADYNTVAGTTTAAGPQHLIIDHTSVALFDNIPQEYIDIVKTRLLILPGESHGTAYGYGLQLLETANPSFNASTHWSGAAETYTDQNLRWNRAFLDNATWNASCGEEDFYTNSAARSDTLTGLQTIQSTYTGSIYFGFGWCWDMTWTNNPTAIKDPVYKCGWAGSSAEGPNENLAWGLDAEDFAITGNSVSLQTYLDAVDYYNQNALNIKTIFTTGPVDNLSNTENGYQRWIKHQAIRNYVSSNGGILFDYAAILSWNYENDQPFTESWTDGDGTAHTWNGRNAHLASGGTGYDGGNGGCHISEKGCLVLGKALWVMLALDAGWDGN